MDMAVFLYHSISEKEYFKSQMEYLNDWQADVVSVYKLIQPSQCLSADSVMLTFDDGNSSDFEIAFPILKALNFTAHFFITTDFIGRKNYMGWAQIKELQRNGFAIGSHTASHRDLSRLSDEDAIYELRHSKAVIEDNLGARIDAISMPHGGYNKKVHRAAKKLGYKAIFTSAPAYRIIDEDPYTFGRFAIKNNTKFDIFCKIASRSRNVKNKMSTLYGFKRFIKFLLPDKMRKRLQDGYRQK